MTTEHNPQTLAAAAREVLNTCCQQSDAAYVAEVHLELELIEQGFMKPDETLGMIGLWDDDRLVFEIDGRDEGDDMFLLSAKDGTVTKLYPIQYKD